jgi:hypothetical protein
MSILNLNLVDLPNEKGIHVKAVGLKHELYVFKYTRHYMNSDGKCRHEAKLIGKYDKESGKMYPNKNFFIFYPLERIPADISVFQYGYTFLICEISNQIGLTNILTNNFGKLGYDILVMASYIMLNGNVLDGIDIWLENSYFNINHSKLTSQGTSKIFSELDKSTRYKFFKDWNQHIALGKRVYYDVTSVSSYSDEIADVEFGYNRDGEHLRQFNIGMFCERESKMPLFYERYNGSINDKTNFTYVLEVAKQIGIYDVDIIGDAGFWSRKCFEKCVENCNTFVIGMPLYLKDAQKALFANKHISTSYKYNLNDIYASGTSVDAIIRNIKGRILLYYFNDKYNDKRKQLFETLQEEKVELSNIKEFDSVNVKKYTRHFNIINMDFHIVFIPNKNSAITQNTENN